MFALRLSSNALTRSASVAHRPVGRSISGACALWLRSGILCRIISSLPFSSARLVGSAADVMTCFWISPMIVDSETVMCSATSATDHRSGAGLNVHCFCESPEIDLRKLSRVVSYCFRANSRSSGVKVLEAEAVVCAHAEPRTTQVIAKATSRANLLTIIHILQGLSYRCDARTNDAENIRDLVAERIAMVELEGQLCSGRKYSCGPAKRASHDRR